MAVNKSPAVFYLSLLLIPFGMYSKTWLPGNISVFGGREPYFIILFGFMIFLFSFDLVEFLSIKIRFAYIERKMILLLLLFVTLSVTVYNTVEISKLRSLLNLTAYAVLIIVYFYVIPKFLFDNPIYFEKFIKIVSNFGFIFSLFGFVIFLLGIYPIPQYGYSLISIINHPNNSSIIMTTTYIPTLFYLLWKRDVLTSASKIFYTFSFFVQLLAQLFTYTRAGMIATSIGLLIFFFFYFRFKFILVIPLFAVIIPVFIVTFFEAKGFASFMTRFYLLLPAFEMILRSNRSLLWGYGVTNAMVEYKKNLLAFNPNEFLINDPHNAYVTLALMLGLLFTLTLLVFVAILLFKCIKKIFKTKERKELLFYLLLFTSSFSILIQGLFDAELVKLDFYTIHYLLIIFGLMHYIFKTRFQKINPLINILKE